MNLYSEGNYDDAAFLGEQILISFDSLNTNNEKYRILYLTLRSSIIAEGYPKAYNFINRQIENRVHAQLMEKYLVLYKATIETAMGEYTNAEQVFLNLLEENNKTFLHDSIKAKIYHNLSVIYSKKENLTKRFEYVKKSFDLEEKLLEQHSNFENFNLSAETYIGIILNRYRQYEKAFKIFQEVLSKSFNSDISEINHSLYVMYIDLLMRMGLENKAAVPLMKLEAFYTERDPYFHSARSNMYLDLSSYYGERHKYTKAIHFANKAISFSKLTPQSYSIRNNAILTLAQIYFEIGHKDKAKVYLHKNIEDSKQVDPKLLAKNYASTSRYLAMMYDDDEAYAYIDSAKHLYYNELKLPPNRQFENWIALSYLWLGQYTQSLYHLNKVASIMEENGNYTHYLYWDNMYEKAICHIKLNEYSTALNILQKASTDMLRVYPHLLDMHSSIQSSRFSILFRKININMAQCLYGQYIETDNIDALKKASVYIDRADEALDYLRQRQRYDSDRLYTGEAFFDFTQLSTNVAIALYKATGDDKELHKAYEFIQKGKSYALLQGVNDNKYKLNSGVPIEIIQQLNTNKDHYDRYELRYNEIMFSQVRDSSLLNYLNESMATCMNKIDSINTFINKKYPSYQRQKNSKQFININEVQNKLAKNQVVIDYYQTEEELFRFTIDKNTFQCDILPIDKSFSQHLTNVINEVSTPFIGQKSVEEIQNFARSAHQLYKVLLEDIEDKIADKELIIVPHDELSYLSFETLLTKNHSNSQPRFKDFSWLIKRQGITYSYNAALLPAYKTSASKFNKVLAFAPAYYGQAKADLTELNKDQSLDSILVPLIGANQEINKIGKYFNTEVHKDSSATKAQFISAMQNNDVLHLAMHALNDENRPFNSQLVFASDDSISGSFTAREVYNYAIKSPLTVLSSCSTGSGIRMKGEGLLSIARAFTFAGVEAQVMTLWPVNDQSGAELIDHFYSNLEAGMRKDAALRASKLEYLASSDGVRSHPYYWANYVLSGSTSPIKQKTPSGLFITLMALAVISVIILYIYDKRKAN